MSDESGQVIEVGNDPVSPEALKSVESSGLIDGLVQVAGAGDDAPVPDAPANDAAAPEAKQPQTPEPPKWDDLSDDRPWTPDRIKSAAAQVKADGRQIYRTIRQLEEREARAKRHQAENRETKRQNELITNRIMADVNSLRSGKGQEVLIALGRLGQCDPHALYEEISLNIVGKPKPNGNGADSPALVEALKEIRELKASLKKQADDDHEYAQSVQRSREIDGEIRELLVDDFWPEIARRAKENPAQAHAEMRQVYDEFCKRSGRELDTARVFNIIEKGLRSKSMASPGPKNQAAGSGPDESRDSSARTANPERAASAASPLNPQLSAEAGAGRRALTEDELAADFARNGPDSWFAQFGA